MLNPLIEIGKVRNWVSSYVEYFNRNLQGKTKGFLMLIPLISSSVGLRVKNVL